MGTGHTLSDHGQAAGMTTPALPPWPVSPPTYGRVRLRAVESRDVAMARELSTDPYVPQTGSLPGSAGTDEAAEWVVRQQSRHAEGTGFSFAIVNRGDDEAIGHCGLWLKEFKEGRATAGYGIVPSKRGRGYASDVLRALTEFAWTVPGLHKVSLFIEPWNTASMRAAERAGYLREGVIASDQIIDGQRRDFAVYAAVHPTERRR